MRCAIAFSIVVPACLAIGWYGHAYFGEQLSRLNISKYFVNVLFFILVMAFVGNVIASNSKDQKQDAADVAQIQQNSDTIDCFGRWAKDSTGSTKTRSEAAVNRDKANVESVKAQIDSTLAMIEVIRGRVVNQVSDSVVIQKSAEEFIEAATEYVEQATTFLENQALLDETRTDTPPPEFSKSYCEKTDPRK